MKLQLRHLLLAVCLLGGCADKHPAPVDRMKGETGWFTAIHAEDPGAKIDVGLRLVLRRGPDGACWWEVGGREASESELREILSQLRKAEIDGVLLYADDKVPVCYVTHTLKILHQYGQRHVVLFCLVEGVQSDFFAKRERFGRAHPEISFEPQDPIETDASEGDPAPDE